MLISLALLFLCAAAGTIVLFTYWLKKRRYFSLASKLPGPTAYPLIGNLLDFVSIDYDVLQVLQVMNNYKSKGLARFWLGNELTVAISDPEYLEVLYNSNALLARPDQYGPIEQWVGEGGLVTAGGEQWKKARRIMIQTFHAITPNDLSKTMTIEARSLVDLLRQYAGKGFFEASPIIRKNGCAIITRIGINESLADNKDLDGALDSIGELTRISVLRFLSPLHYFDATFSMTQDGKTFTQLKDKLRNVMRKIVIRKQREYGEILKNGEDVPNIFIYNLLEKYGDESIEDLTTHLLTLMASAVDTSADTIGFALLMAGIFPDVQEKLHQEDLEIQSRLGGAELGPSVLQHYQYLDRVIKETLRLYPGFPMTGRSSTEEVQLGKYVIPEGTNVLAMNFYTNRREDLFANADKFDPDRFLPENTKNLHPYAFLPFGIGLRNCAGTKYALLTIKIEVTMLIRAFKITAEYKTKSDLEKNLFADIVLRDKNHARLKIEERY